MLIHKVLNNNVVICKDAELNDIIVTGKGIAFQKIKGDEIDIASDIKVYTLNNSTVKKKFQEVVSQIPIEYMDISEKIIDYAKRTIGKEINDTIYVTLTDHIYSTCERYRQQIKLKNDLYWDIKRLYKEEFKVGEKAVDKIRQVFQLDLLDDEAAFIAMHFVNAELDNNVNDVASITIVINDILNIVKYHFKISYDEDSISYGRFITHLKFFSYRILTQKPSLVEDKELLSIIADRFPEAEKCAHKIEKMLLEHYDHKLTIDEKFYLIIHIERIVKESC
ncbi:BglG family transcription antiterminator LicT [Niallia taxi]|uniref:BglG family transcription antiterminator LicT n=1 Tax=Niallia taxi TaxID=2499688 RepID=UPI00300BF823